MSLRENTSVIREKGESQNGCFKKAKHAKISEYVSGGKKCLFFGILACFAFLKHPFWDSPFCLIADEYLLLLDREWFRKNIDFTESFSLKNEAFYFILHIVSKFFIQSLMRFKSTETFQKRKASNFFLTYLTKSCLNFIVLLMELAASIVIKSMSY